VIEINVIAKAIAAKLKHFSISGAWKLIAVALFLYVTGGPAVFAESKTGPGAPRP
jgi:hypothetical protein